MFIDSSHKLTNTTLTLAPLRPLLADSAFPRGSAYRFSAGTFPTASHRAIAPPACVGGFHWLNSGIFLQINQTLATFTSHTKAKGTGRGIALEDLKGFSGQQTVRKSQKERFGKWAFDQLRRFITYKAKLDGVPVVTVNSRNTSRTCSACGHCDQANRKSQARFSCQKCDHTMNADLNAALNIAQKAKINPPIAV